MMLLMLHAAMDGSMVRIKISASAIHMHLLIFQVQDSVKQGYGRALIWLTARWVSILDYAMGENLKNRMPLWIKPDNKIGVKDVMGMMRNYYQGTPMDMTKDVGAGPYGSTVRWRPMEWKVDSVTYIYERAISTQQTGFSFVAQSRSWLPDPVGGIIWFGVDDTYYTVYSPMYCGITRVPETFAVGNGDMMTFSDNSAFWVFNQVTNFAYTRTSLLIGDLQKKQNRT